MPARILLVEDEPSIAEPFTAALRRAGYEAQAVGTAADAMRAARDRPPDLVVLDLMLPDGDGRDVCRELRRTSDVPIVMLTARGSELDRVVGLELGADDYVVKPFSSAEVVARIRAILRRAGGRRETGPPRQRIDGLVIDRRARRAVLDGTELALTRKEYDLLERLAVLPRLVPNESGEGRAVADLAVGPG